MKRLLFPNGESKVRSNPLEDLQETTDSTFGIICHFRRTPPGPKKEKFDVMCGEKFPSFESPVGYPGSSGVSPSWKSRSAS